MAIMAEPIVSAHATDAEKFRWIMKAGWHGLCPRCGEGRMFRAWLKIADHCDACGLDYDFATPDDGPAFFSLCFIAFPLIANELWRFVAPGLYKKEQKALLPFLLATPILFTCGAALAYYGVMPAAFRFFLGFQQLGGVNGINREALPAMGEYLDLVMSMILAFGVAFLLPVLLMLLERAGIINRKQLIAGRRYAVVASFVVAAVLTPPDLWSQVALAIPLMLLYEISIIGIWFTEKSRAQVAASEQSGESAA